MSADPRPARCFDCPWIGMVERGPRDDVPRCPSCGGYTEALRVWDRFPCPECGHEPTVKSPHEEHAYCERHWDHEDDEPVACPPVRLISLDHFAAIASAEAPR